MRQRVKVAPSTKPGKRYKAEFPTKTIHFGQKGGSTFIDHGSVETKHAWEKRHKPRENWSDWDSAGALSKNLLWNKKTLTASLRDLNTLQSQYKFVTA